MTDPQGPRPAGDVRACAAEWLAQKVSSDWTDQQQSELEAWLEASPTHRVAFLRVEGAWSHTYRLAVLRQALPERPQPAHGASRSLLRAAVVAGIIAVISAGAAIYLLNPQEKAFETPLGGRERVTLRDGSAIELNTDTKLRVRISATQRQLWLDKGEAYFKVVHDANHPFILIVGSSRITDLGTRFAVRRDTGGLTITLLEGRVRFDATNMPQRAPIDLVAGDELITSGKSISLNCKTTAEMSKSLGWERGLLIFENARLAEVAAEFNRYNVKKLRIADAKTARRTIGASFPTNDVELFADMARDVLGLHVESHGNEIVISR